MASSRRDRREKLVLDHLHLVPAIARGIFAKLPPGFELDDLIQTGRLGLITAAQTYQARRGPFAPWARFKVRLAIIDSIQGEPFEYAKSKDEYIENTEETAEWGQGGLTMDRRRRAQLARQSVPVIEAQKPAEETGPPPTILMALHRAIANLDDQKRRLVDLAYAGTRPVKTELRSIGREKVLGIGWRRVLDEHQQAIDELRDALMPRDKAA